MKKKKESNKGKQIKKILGNIVLVSIVVIFLSLIDIVLVTKFETGPIFAIKTKEHTNKSKEYYGLFYKVIKYQEEGGRYDTVIGSWSLEYEDTPIKIELFDFALEYVDHNKATYDAFYNKYVLLTEKISYIDTKNKIIRFEYIDTDQKYSFATDIYLQSQDINLNSYKKNDTITIVGTVKGFKNKDSNGPNRIIIKNGFIK